MTEDAPTSHFDSQPISFRLVRGKPKERPFKDPNKGKSPPKAEQDGEDEDEEEQQDKAGGCSCGCAAGGRVSVKALWTKWAGRLVDDKQLARFLESVSATLRKQVDAIVKEIRAAGRPTPQLVDRVLKLLDKQQWDPVLSDALAPYLRRAVDFGYQFGMEQLGRVVSSPAIAEIGLKPKELADYAEQASVTLSRTAASGINTRTQVRVAEILGDGIQQGETTSQLIRRVRDWAAKEGDAARSTRARAETIARTEAARAASASTEHAWQATGLVKGKRWLLAPDPCEFCEAAAELYGKDGVGVGEQFFPVGTELKGADGGTMVLDYSDVAGPPLHPRCRCAMVPVLIDDYQPVIDDAMRRMEARRARNRANQGATDEG